MAALRQELGGSTEVKGPVPLQQTATIESLADPVERDPAGTAKKTPSHHLREADDCWTGRRSPPSKADWLRYFEEFTTFPEARSPIEGLAGIEPATPALGRRRSVH